MLQRFFFSSFLSIFPRDLYHYGRTFKFIEISNKIILFLLFFRELKMEMKKSENTKEKKNTLSVLYKLIHLNKGKYNNKNDVHDEEKKKQSLLSHALNKMKNKRKE